MSEIEELKKKFKGYPKKLSAEEIAALTDVEKIARIEQTTRMWKREAVFDRALGFYTVWCFVLGTVGTVYLMWKLLKWLL